MDGYSRQYIFKNKSQCYNIPEYDKTSFTFFFFLNQYILTHSHCRAYLIVKMWGTIQLLYFVDSVLSHT